MGIQSNYWEFEFIYRFDVMYDIFFFLEEDLLMYLQKLESFMRYFIFLDSERGVLQLVYSRVIWILNCLEYNEVDLVIIQ